MTNRAESSAYILLPLGASPATEAKLLAAQQQAQALQAPLLLLHVLPPSAIQPATVTPNEATARARLDALAVRLGADGLAVRALVRAGQPATVIVATAQALRARLIVLGSTVRSRLPRVLLGSVADAVIRDAPCPVLLVRSAVPPDPTEPLLTLDPPDFLVPRDRGRRRVELSRIVGSATRPHELSANFRLQHASAGDQERFRGILLAYTRGDEVPPVELYKYGFGYYVRDGHHRVAAALELGRQEIDAQVTELAPFGDDEAERTAAARRAFEEATGLTRIGAARAESYDHLLDAIHTFWREQGVDSLPEAAARWFEAVYQPLWRRVRAPGQAPTEPGERPADVIARAAAWRRVEAGPDGPQPRWDEALRVVTAPASRRTAAGPGG